MTATRSKKHKYNFWSGSRAERKERKKWSTKKKKKK
jgi:hypothetical protein